ncbi:MAG TPA: C4-type zinc ribbon domain-containing protein [Acidimicrobiales bacterium]|nr:C4-type zinc ribbon domain-containing protein [Acidimicrobiales bacterium]
MAPADGDVRAGTPTPSPGPLERLLDVQHHDTVIDQLRHRRATLPERGELADGERRLGDLEARNKEVRGQRDELGGRQEALEEQIESSRTRKATLEKRLYGGQVAAARDLQAMADEVKHLARHISDLEDRELELMEALEPVDGELQEADVARDALETRATSLRAAIAAAEATLDAEIAQESTARAEVARGVPPDLLARYDRLRSRLGGTGAARLVGVSCSGCHLALPSMEVDRIRKAPPDAVITCDQCGRILVR